MHFQNVRIENGFQPNLEGFAVHPSVALTQVTNIQTVQIFVLEAAWIFGFPNNTQWDFGGSRSVAADH
jgi:hypothetical protein